VTGIERRTAFNQKQIPFGNDRKKSRAKAVLDDKLDAIDDAVLLEPA
jgi:hypothetical protein